METSRAALVFSLLMCSSWTILNGSAMGQEDAVPPVLHNLTSTFIHCKDCDQAVKLLKENFNSSTPKEDICKSLDRGILSKKGKCNNGCREFVKKNMKLILDRLHGKGLDDICKDTKACTHPLQA